jgi:hypothetical protein
MLTPNDGLEHVDKDAEGHLVARANELARFVHGLVGRSVTVSRLRLRRARDQRASQRQRRAGVSRADSGMSGRISCWADSAVEHLAQAGGERVRVAGLAVLPA